MKKETSPAKRLIKDILRKKLRKKDVKELGTKDFNSISKHIRSLIQDRSPGTENVPLSADAVRDFMQEKHSPTDRTLDQMAIYYLNNGNADFGLYVKQIERLKTMQRLFAAAGLLLFLFLLFKFLWPATTTQESDKSDSSPRPRTIVKVLLAVNRETDYDPETKQDFYTNIAKIFNDTSQEFELIFEEKYTNSHSTEQLEKELSTGQKRFDVLLGCPPEVHEFFKDTLHSVPMDLTGLDLEPGLVSQDSTWVAIYYGMPGLVYNAARIQTGFHSFSLVDLPQYLKGQKYRCFPPTSAGAFWLVYNLSGKPGKNFDPDKGLRIYENLYVHSYKIKENRDKLLNLAYGELDFDLLFLHDAAWKTQKLGFPDYKNVLRYQLLEGTPEVVCMSIRNNNDNRRLKGAQAFARFFLSPEIQRLQYQRQLRIPVLKKVRDVALKSDSSDYGRAMDTFFMHFNYPLTSYGSMKDQKEWENYCKKVYDRLLVLRKTDTRDSLTNSGLAPENALGFKFGN